MHPPEHPPASAFRWVSLPEAVRILGKAETTIRREIRAGTIIAEAEPREPGSSRIRYRVRIDDPPPSAVADALPESVHPPASAEPIHHDPPTSATDALTAALDTISGLVERTSIQGAEIAALSERAARAEAERDILRAELERARARRWWQWW
jgi:hypothetical protein